MSSFPPSKINSGTLIDGIQIFKTNKEDSLLAMRRYLRGASEEILEEIYGYFGTRIQKFPYPSIEAIKTALDMMSDQYPQARSVDPQEVVDLAFVKQVEAAALYNESGPEGFGTD